MGYTIRVGCVMLTIVALLSATAWYLSTFHDKYRRWVMTSEMNEVAMLSVHDGRAYVGIRSAALWPQVNPLSLTEPYGTNFLFT